MFGGDDNLLAFQYIVLERTSKVLDMHRRARAERDFLRRRSIDQ